MWDTNVISRRALLRGQSRPIPLKPRPPGVTSASLGCCTGCGLCVDACPENVLIIADGMVEFQVGAGECTFCSACAEVCPEEVFTETGRMMHVMKITPDCFVEAGISCMSCRDTCPEAAITLTPRIGAPFVPRLDPTVCTGCGACMTACPADAIKPTPRETEYV